MAEVKRHSLVEVRALVGTYEQAPRRMPGEVVCAVAQGGSAEERFDRRMKALEEAQAWTVAEREACAAINAATARLLQELGGEIAAFEDAVREAVLCRCGEVVGECSDAVQRVRAEGVRLRRAKGDASRCDAEEARLVAASRATVDTLLASKGLVRVDRLSFEPDDRQLQRGMHVLKEWTGKKAATIVYDSRIDPFTKEGLFEKVKDKQNIAIVGFTTDGDVFGGFHAEAVTEKGKGFIDNNFFLFSLESHGRCVTPQRFVAKACVYVLYCKEYDQGVFVSFDPFLRFGLTFGDEKTGVKGRWRPGRFQGIQDTTLTGKTSNDSKTRRLVAIHLT